MKLTNSIKNALFNMKGSIARYPLVLLATIAITILNAIMIEQPRQDYTRLLLTFIIGALLSMVGQAIYEHFLQRESQRYQLMAGAIVIAIAYYYIVGPQTLYNIPITTKTLVASFALLITYICIPSIGTPKVSFHQTFLILIKALFTTLLFTLVLTLGISAIYYATDYLLFPTDYEILTHLLNIIVSIIAPLLFLSMIPVFPSREQGRVPSESWSLSGQTLTSYLTVPKFFIILLSYILIPLIAVYTLILVIYIALNISGAFWTDNLLEPLLVSYAIIGILVLILSFNIDNRFTKPFRTWFPKILVPIVVFQTIASFLKIQESGLTHGRYYVILFGIFASISALAYAFLRERGHRYVVITLLLSAIISIIPPIDAFTVSKSIQLNLLEGKLKENQMLEDAQILPSDTPTTEDKIVISNIIIYLNRMNYTRDVDFLPEGFNYYSDFEEVFGFPITYSNLEYNQDVGNFLSIDWEDHLVFEVASYDIMIHFDFYYSELTDTIEDTVAFTVDGNDYEFIKEWQDTHYHFIISDDQGNQLIDFDSRELFDHFFVDDADLSVNQRRISSDEASLVTENENIRLDIKVVSLHESLQSHSGSLYLLIEIK